MMRTAVLGFLALVHLFSLPASAEQSDAGTRGVAISPGFLMNRWTTAAGDSLLIDGIGRARFVSSRGDLLETGTVKVIFQREAFDHGFCPIYVVALAVTIRGTTWVSPGELVAGEGDGASLVIYNNPIVFSKRLASWGANNECRAIHLEGEQP